MIDKLWRKKYEFVADKNGQVIVKLEDGTYDFIWVWKDKALQDVVVFSENGIKFIEEYCYLDDLIAQANKAERLEKENEAMRQEFEVWHGNHECVLEDKERLQKAVDSALGWLEKVATPAKCDDDLCREFTKRKVNEIKQLTKE